MEDEQIILALKKPSSCIDRPTVNAHNCCMNEFISYTRLRLYANSNKL